MVYLSTKTIVDSYIGFQSKVTNKTWGLLAILKAIESEVSVNTTYSIPSSKLSTILNELFCISDERLKLNRGETYWYVMFSNQWADFFQSKERERCNIYDIIGWVYRKRDFPTEIDNLSLLNLFSSEYHIPVTIIRNYFSLQDRYFEFSDQLCSGMDLLDELKKNFSDITNPNITAEGRSVAALPGELSRGPFIQPLYAALDTVNYLIIGQSNISELYNICATVDVSVDCSRPTNKVQQIFYGAPGTGKSNAIKELTSEKNEKEKYSKDFIFRTTFHPDSDYASFVGAYKPIWDEKNEKIIYEFRSQSFLKAYVAAWTHPEEKVALIIEEINRGNCSQIFGDIFQLLDRYDEGWSKYPIEADVDMQKYLERAFSKDESQKAFNNNKDKDRINDKYNDHYTDAFDKIKEGKILTLPHNLSILATMNTSDQSLFPMDSAFKRRWDWEYMPIKDERKNWKIKVSDRYEYVDWWEFLERINAVIAELTTSEDKQLGYYFCMPDDRSSSSITKREDWDVITANRFVSKVIFYLWNDVFKDYAFDPDCCKDENRKEVLFAQFYIDAKNVNTKVLSRFFEALDKDNDKHLLKDKTKPDENKSSEEVEETKGSALNETQQESAAENPEDTDSENNANEE